MTPLQDKAVGALVGRGGRRRARRRDRGLDARADPRALRRLRRRASSRRTSTDWRNARPIAPYHKGDGHVTDDTLMTHALVRVYAKVRRPPRRVRDRPTTWSRLMIERAALDPRAGGARRCPLQRVFLAEKWLVARLHYGHVDPREAGVGNIVNCGAAMYMAPVGIVNAGDPAGAYAEAIDVAGAHQSSYGREAAGVFAAAVAAAMRAGRDVDDVVVDGGLRLARDGTPRRDRGGLRARPSADTDWRDGAARAAGRGHPVRHGRARLPRAGPGRPAAEPAAVHRGAARRARHAAGRPAATTAAPCSAR